MSDTKSQSQLNTILKWVLGTGLLASSMSLAAKVFRENRDTAETKKLEERLSKYTEPEEVVEISKPDIAASTTNIDPEKRRKLLTKTAAINESYANALTILLSLLATGAGAWGTSKLYNQYKRKELENQEEQAKKHYLNKIYVTQKLDELEKEEQKPMFRYASEGMTKTARGDAIDTVMGGIYALLASSAIAAAIYGRNYMSKKFPKIQHRSVDEDLAADLTSADRIARKIKFIEKGEPKSEKEAIKATLEDFDKVASCFEPDLNAAVVKIAADMETATGDFHGINEVIDCVALGQAENLKQCGTLSEMMDYAHEYMKNNVKVASDSDKACARLYIGLDPILSEVFVPNAIIEMNNRIPSMEKQASQTTDEDAAKALLSLLLCQAADTADTMQKCASIEDKTAMTKEEADAYMEKADKLLEHDLIGDYLMREREW